MTPHFCSCPPDKRDWYGIARIISAPVDPRIKGLATQYAGRVMCWTCCWEVRWDHWQGEPVGSLSITSAAGMIGRRGSGCICSWSRSPRNQWEEVYRVYRITRGCPFLVDTALRRTYDPALFLRALIIATDGGQQ